jgi:Rod binding domain-containing protein
LSIKVTKEHSPISVDQQKKSHKTKPELVDDYKYIPKAYKDVASGMEKQFAEFMITQMNNSVGAEETNSGAKYYKSLMNSERADIMATKDQGLGLQKVILDQIYPQRMRSEIAYKQFLAAQENRIIKKNDIQMAKPDAEGKEPVNE